ncbi:hypothetical protein NHQ30_011230 [Ciborinia camelliae]|nr:hypothetical protein NHQ30_011230 [Ciborinia camelliae]
MEPRGSSIRVIPAESVKDANINVTEYTEEITPTPDVTLCSATLLGVIPQMGDAVGSACYKRNTIIRELEASQEFSITQQATDCALLSECYGKRYPDFEVL